MNRALSIHDQLDMLREENRQLREQLAVARGQDELCRVTRIFSLTALQAKIFCLLLSTGEAGKYELIDGCYDIHMQAMMGDTELALRCAVKHMRRHIRPHGLDVETIYAVGYRMTEENRRRARELMGAAA